jgi:four helix bundle protein
MDRHRRLYAWQRAHALSIAVHQHSRRIRERTYPGLCERLRRTGHSIAHGLADGASSDDAAALHERVDRALDLARELESDLESVRDLGALPRADALLLLRHTIEVKRLLLGLVGGLRPLVVLPPVRPDVPRGADSW